MSILLTVTAKGQVTLRRSVLDHLGVRPGDKIAIDFLSSGRAQVRSARAPKSIDGVIGRFARAGATPLTIDAMNDIAASGWSGISDPDHRERDTNR